MELKLDIYKTRLLKEVERTVSVQDFKLATGVCEDVMEIIQIDLFENGVEGLSEESQKELTFGLIKNGLPFFKELLIELFEISEDEYGRTDQDDVGNIIYNLIQYSIKKLASSIKDRGTKSKN